VLTDAQGVPLAVTTTAANTHDIKAALPTLLALEPVKGRRGRPRRRPDQLVADKAYDSEPLRGILRWLGIKAIIPHRGESSQGLGRARWPVERTIAWLHQFRRLRIRWERRADIHQAFLHLGAAMICYRILRKDGFCP
jgi:transposase